MPRHLDARAKTEQRRPIPILERMRVLTEADGTMLAIVCADISLLDQAQENLVKTGMLVKTGTTGGMDLNPLLHLVTVTADRLARGPGSSA